MGAITGIFRRDGRLTEKALVDRMLDRVAFRGPDGRAVWAGDVAALAACVLKTGGNGTALLPVSAGEGLVVAADARLDDRRELAAAIGDPELARASSDAGLILAAYQKWGEECPAHLMGDFAFAIWDERRRILFCARDAVGVCPFYYHLSDRAFLFGSEIKALLADAEVPRRLNEEAVAAYLGRFFEDKQDTFYRDIQRLPPAHAMTVSADSVRAWRYWALETDTPVRLAGDGEYAEAFLDVFTRAVRRRLGEGEQIGCMLSGGLDSSSIACTASHLMARNGGLPLHTFSAVFPEVRELDRRIDEQRYIQAVLATGNFQPHTVAADRFGPLSGVVWHEDEPLPAPSLYMDRAVFHAASGAGVKVLLSGNDGDTTVSYGYELLTQLARSGRWFRLARESKALAAHWDVRRWKRVAWELGFKPLAPAAAATAWRRLCGRPQPPWGPHSVISAEFARRTNLAERIRKFGASPLRRARTPAEEHRNALDSGLMLWVVEVLCKAGAAQGLELRFPFFDRELMQFCVSLPADQKLQNGLNRAVMRRAMDGILPAEVRTRVKKGSMSTNFKTRLLQYDRPALDRLMNEDRPLLARFTDADRLREEYDRFLAAPVRAEQEALNLFLAANLAAWLRSSELGG